MKRPTFFYGYLILATCFCIQGIGVGTYVTFGVFFKALIAEFGWSRATLSGAHSLTFLIAGMLGILIGRLNDRVGPRILMTVTGFIYGVGFILMSRLNTVWQLYVFYSLIVGVGLSSVDVIALSTTARWFIRRRGMVTGIVKVGTGAGQLVMPLLASLLIAGFGWRISYIIIGVLAMALLMAVAQLLQRDPARMGLLPDADTQAQTPQTGPMETGFSFQEALRSRQFWTICLAFLSGTFCLMIVMLHIVPQATDVGISATAAASILSTIGGVSMAGRFLTGSAIDRIGNRRAMIICFILIITALLWLQISKVLWMYYLFALVYGFAHGGTFTVISPLMAEYFGLRSHGLLFGLAVFAGTVGGFFGPIFAGRVFDVTGSYTLALWTCVAVACVGLGLLLSLRHART